MGHKLFQKICDTALEWPGNKQGTGGLKLYQRRMKQFAELMQNKMS